MVCAVLPLTLSFVTMDQVNLKRLAKELGLAISTVSRALRDSHEISQETKDRV